MLILVFAAAFGVFAIYQHYSQEQKNYTYEEMAQSKLAQVRLEYLENCSNTLRGYLQKMDVSTMRGCITPLSKEHKVRINIEYEGSIDEVSYEVRGLDGTRLVEDGIINGWDVKENTSSAQLQLSNLVGDKNEYQLILCVRQDNTDVYYYSRIIYMASGNTERMIGFAHDFMQASIQGNTDFVVNYIQPDASMGTDDFSYVTQHSRSGMITWKGLNTQIGEVSTLVTELTDTQAGITLTYPITLTSNEESRECMVSEQYVVRYRNDVLYLLDFERHVNQIFSAEQPHVSGSALEVGISDNQVSGMASDDANIQIYVYDGHMYSSNTKKNTLKLIYTYKSDKDELNDCYQIQPIRVENSGDIYFMVYGYHSKGNHEGQVGVSFLHYLSDSSYIDEIFYIPVSFSEEILMKNMGTLAYVNNESDLMYLLYGNTVYSIDLSSGEKVELAETSSAGSFYSNESNSLIAWEESNSDKTYTMTIRIADLSTGKMYKVDSEESEFLCIQGFLGNDLVYGVGRETDLVTKAGQIIQMPMYKLKIVSFDDGMSESGEYQKSDIYIEKTQLLENQIEICRMVKDLSGYKNTENDQMFVNNRNDKRNITLTKSRIEDGFGKMISIALKVDAESATIDAKMGKIRDKNASYQLNLENKIKKAEYYVYAGGKLSKISSSLKDAIGYAYDKMGVVVDTNANYVWTRGTRALNKKLPFEELTVQDNEESLLVCLKILCSSEGADVSDIESMFEEGYAPDKIIEKVIGSRDEISTADKSKNASVQNLKGCTIAQLLYYLNEDHMVLAITGDKSALLITGYDTKNVILYDPVKGEAITMAQTEADEYFEQYDRVFLTWLE